jgi:hypothetical protein
MATPLEFVTAVFVPPANVPLAPVAGGAKVTVAPGVTLPKLSLTVTTNGNAKAVVTFAVCGVPLVTAICAGGPGVFVSAKLAGVATPATLAATL